jgi:hypothetical protein
MCGAHSADFQRSQRFAAAFLAISTRRSAVIFAARALPPRAPSSAAADFAESGRSSGFLTGGDPHHLDGIADHVGGALFASRAAGILGARAMSSRGRCRRIVRAFGAGRRIRVGRK